MRPLLQDADGGDVGQRPRRHPVGGRPFAGGAAKEVQRADDLLTQPQRDRAHRPQVPANRSLGERRPGVVPLQIRRRDRFPAADAVAAGTFLALHLQQLKIVDGGRGATRHIQPAATRQEQTGSVDVEQINARVDQVDEQFGDVVVRHQRVSHADQGTDQTGLMLGRESQLLLVLPRQPAKIPADTLDEIGATPAA